MLIPDISETPDSAPARNGYQGVILVLLAASILGTAAAITGGISLTSPVLLAAAVTLFLSSALLALVVVDRRTPPAKLTDESPPHDRSSPEAEQKEAIAGKWVWDFGTTIRRGAAVAGLLAVALLIQRNITPFSLSAIKASVAAFFCLTAAGLSATAASYLADLDETHFPEAPGLCRLARVLAWILLLAALAMIFAWAKLQLVLRILFLTVQAVNAALCLSLLLAKPEESTRETFDIGVLYVLGSRPNVLASVLDAAEHQLGIDLRSTWAITVIRRTIEPLVIVLCLLGWLSTSLTVVSVEEQALVERLGVPVSGEPLQPGLHAHWPWPVDRVYLIPIQRIQTLMVGHESELASGPENVLWAREHAANEYTLLLGNGRDLITVDAAVQFRISDARAWRYHCQNPADALRAIAYRAVMRSTVDRTLAEALSENLVVLAREMRAMVQQDADALGLGIHVTAFTIGGMHPPVMVASDYQAVVSAELRKVTLAVEAQAYRNQTVPAAEALVLAGTNTAKAEGTLALARAAGEAWSFRTLESQYRAAPEEYFFRRRLETLESGLGGRRFTILDARIQRDGGELWLIP